VLLTIGRQRELLTVDVQAGKIRAVYHVIDPDKLSYLDRQLGQVGPGGGGANAGVR
jgi:hypothetical protein